MKDFQHDDDCPPLPACSEDAILIAQWRETRSRGALDRLVRANLGRVRNMARAWSRGMALQDDLVSEGMLALIGCLDGYAPQPEVPFFAYARPFVRAAMRRRFYGDAAILSVPMHHVRALRAGKGSALDEALFRAATNPERLDGEDAPDLGVDCDSGEAVLLRTEAEKGRGRALDGALAALSETDRLFVARWRKEGGSDLSDLALRCGVTPAQALRREARALARLRNQLILRGVTSADLGCGA